MRMPLEFLERDKAHHLQLFQLRLSDPTQAYATRPKGSVGSCKSDLV